MHDLKRLAEFLGLGVYVDGGASCSAGQRQYSGSVQAMQMVLVLNMG